MPTNENGRAIQDVVREGLKKLGFPFDENVVVPNVLDVFGKKHDIDFVVDGWLAISVKSLLSCNGTAHEKFVKEADYLCAVIEAGAFKKAVLLILGSRSSWWDGVNHFAQSRRGVVAVVFDRSFSRCFAEQHGRRCAHKWKPWHNAPFANDEYVAGLLRQLV